MALNETPITFFNVSEIAGVNADTPSCMQWCEAQLEHIQITKSNEGLFLVIMVLALLGVYRFIPEKYQSYVLHFSMYLLAGYLLWVVLL